MENVKGFRGVKIMFLIGSICFIAGYFLCLVVIAAVNVGGKER